MPTDLPPRRTAPARAWPKLGRLKVGRLEIPRPATPKPASSREGNLAFAIAIIVMLVISAVLLWLHPADAASLAVHLPSFRR